MNATLKLGAAGVVVAAVLVYLVVDSTRQAPEENPVATGQEYERVVMLQVDLSGSFLQLMAEKGKAYEFLLRVLDRYMRGNANEKLILGQLSGSNASLLWDGTPAQLRKDFPDQAAFRKHLLAKADPNSSRLHDGMTDALRYLKGLPGVTAKTKCALLVLSDLEDNWSAAGSEQRLVTELREFGKRGGAVGFYFVDLHRVEGWKGHLRSAGVKHHVVESSIVTTPSLPALD